MIAVFSFAAISCIDEIGNTDIPTAETGDEVQFGLFEFLLEAFVFLHCVELQGFHTQQHVLLQFREHL